MVPHLLVGRPRGITSRGSAFACSADRFFGSRAGVGRHEEQELHHRRSSGTYLKARVRLFIRHNIRNSELGLAMVAAALGAVIALGVALTGYAVAEFHHLLYGVPIEQRLTGIVDIARWRLLLVPCVGGLVYGVIAYALWRWRPRDIVDAIEANALHGGHMSLSDSLRLTGLTVLSAGVGASVGLEAAYTQLGAGIASRIGRICICGATICAHLSGAAPLRRSPPRSTRRSPARFTPSS